MINLSVFFLQYKPYKICQFGGQKIKKSTVFLLKISVQKQAFILAFSFLSGSTGLKLGEAKKEILVFLVFLVFTICKFRYKDPQKYNPLNP